MTHDFGVVVFIDSDGEPVDPELLRIHSAGHSGSGNYVWGRWRPAALDELVKTWPARSESKPEGEIWWQPPLDEPRLARKSAGSLVNRQRRSSTWQSSPPASPTAFAPYNSAALTVRNGLRRGLTSLSNLRLCHSGTRQGSGRAPGQAINHRLGSVCLFAGGF
jgi:hypothetical protein